MSLSIKPGARIFGMRPEMAVAAVIVDGVFRDLGTNATITCASDGKHSSGSFHYNGLATDYRIHDVPKDKQPTAKNMIAERLGQDFDVILEGAGTPNAHIHIEFQPKTGVNLG